MSNKNFSISIEEIQKSKRLVEGLNYFKRNVANDKLVIQLHRKSSKNGPEYSISIASSGQVIYDGIKGVRTIGKRDSYISRENLFDLIDEFQNAYFFSLKDTYTEPNNIDTEGTIITSITIGNDSKMVLRYENCTSPKGLIELENFIDGIVDSQQWTGIKVKG